MSLTNDEIQLLHTALDRGEPTPWLFDEDGLRVLGTVRRLEEISTKDFGQALTLVLEVDGKERRILLTTVLRRKLKRLDPKAGEPIGIERDPKKTRPKDGGAAYWDFQVRLIEDEQPKELNWGSRTALPEAIEAEIVLEDDYEVQHLPRDTKGVSF